MGDKNKPLEDENSAEEKLKPKSRDEGDGDKLDKMLFYAGDIGRYQKFLCLATLPFGFTFCCNYYVGVFIMVKPENYWCKIPELNGLNQELRRNLSAPGAITGEWNQCMTYDTNWTHVLHTLKPPPDGTPLIPCQNGWEFDFSVIPYETIITERGWVCDRNSYPAITTTVFFCGSLVGGIFFGWIADRYGRKPAIIGSNLLSGIGGVLSIFTKGIVDFSLCKFLIGLSFDSSYMVMYILVLEFIGPQHRTLMANVSFALSYVLGAVLVPWIAYFIADWRILLWVTTLQAFVVIAVPWALPESAKWLLSKGRVKEVVMVLKKFEAVNKTKIPDYAIEEFLVSSSVTQPEQKYSIRKLFHNSLGQCMVAIMLLYFGYGIIFDGLVRVTDSLGMTIFSLLSASSACELLGVGIVALTLDRFGRRNLISALLFTSGVFLLSCMFIPKGNIRAVLSILGRLFMNSCVASTQQWVHEILPTPLRVSGYTVIHTVSYIANLLTPYIPYLEKIWVGLPILLFPLTAFLMTGVSLTLPETRGMSMPQTIEDSEKMIRNHSLCRTKHHMDEAFRLPLLCMCIIISLFVFVYTALYSYE